jgi:nucleoside-diphosphate-sugar epimerase
MRCLITGVAGFVGSHLAERLLQQGHEVCGVDGFIDSYPRALKDRNLEGARSWNTFRFVEGNLLEMRLLPLLDGIDWLFHQSAQAGVRSSWGNEFSQYVNCNVLVTQRLLEAALLTQTLRRFVYASSSSIYGEVFRSPVSEADLPHPISPYGVTKLAAEQLCQLYFQNFFLPTVSLRYFTVYGPRQRPDMAFHRFCKAIMERETIYIFGDGQQTRDFTYISDIVEANILAASLDSAVGTILNIAGGSSVTIQHALKMLKEISGLPVSVQFSSNQAGDALHTHADIARARQLLHYSPQVSLWEGLNYEFQDIARLYAR